MPWFYSQSSGNTLLNDQTVGKGYSGHGPGLCNPGMQHDPMTGPIPRGIYTIGPSFDHPAKGPVVMSLQPSPANSMFGRSGFLIHGDNSAGNHTASEGCIILANEIREQISKASDRQLIVTE
jgi:hypothetical protein